MSSWVDEYATDTHPKSISRKVLDVEATVTKALDASFSRQGVIHEKKQAMSEGAWLPHWCSAARCERHSRFEGEADLIFEPRRGDERGFDAPVDSEFNASVFPSPSEGLGGVSVDAGCEE